MSLPTGLNINTIMGAAANGVSKTLEGRRKRSEQKADDIEAEGRAMDQEEELFRRKDRRIKDAEMEKYIATINSYLPPAEASALISKITNHSGMGVVVSQMASLANNNVDPFDVYKLNKEKFSSGAQGGEIPYGSLFIPPKKAEEPKYVDSLDKMYSINLQEQFGAKTRDELVRLRFEQEKIEQRIIEKHGLTNKGKSEEEYKPFSKEKASAIVEGSFNTKLKTIHGLNENLDGYAQKLTQWRNGNRMTVLKERFGHSRYLANQVNDIKKTDGWDLSNEPIYTSLVSAFNGKSTEMANNTVRKVEQSAFYGKTTINDPFRLVVPDDAKVNSVDNTSGNVVGYAVDYSKITTTEKDVLNNFKQFKYKNGDIVPYIDESSKEQENPQINYFIFTESAGFYDNLHFRKKIN